MKKTPALFLFLVMAASSFCVTCGSTKSVKTAQEITGDEAGAIISGIISLYNSKIAGKAGGAQNQTGSCPGGGTAQITGTAGSDSSTQINTVNLTYNFSSCVFLNSRDLLAITITSGSINESGTFKSSGFADETFSGTIAYTGKAGDEKLSASSCAVAITRKISGTSYKLSGKLCDRPF